MFKKISSVFLCIIILSSISMSISIANEKNNKKNSLVHLKNLEIFNKVLYLIDHQYYRKINFEKLIEGAINGMIDTLDPHSMYLNKKVFKRIQEDTSGEFGGFGVEVTQKDGVITVITPIVDSPAEKAGILAGDKIVEINHHSTVGLKLDEAISLMKSSVKYKHKIIIGIERKGIDKILIKEIKNALIKINSVSSKIVSKNIIYIRLKQFQKGSARDMLKALKKLDKKIKNNKESLNGIILDLRNNPGGLLDEAVNVASIFLKSGIVVRTESRDPKQQEIRYVKKNSKKYTKKALIVLLNARSASASEIVAGALQDHKRAIIMGNRSFGKGSVQTIAKLSANTGIKLTIAQYMTPNKRKIQALGIKPDIFLSNTESKWFDKNEIAVDTSIREKDLKNHLSATIESKSEKLLRLEKEKINRQKRIKKYKKWKKNQKLKYISKTENDTVANKKSSRLSTNYWIIEATRQIKAINKYLQLKL